MKKIVVTGGAGFVGSNVVAKLAAEGTYDIVVCDRFGTGNKWRNLRNHALSEVITPERLISWLQDNKSELEAIIHLGGIYSTTEQDVDLILSENLTFSIALWRWCNQNETRFIYASSSTTYGAGEHGFDDHGSTEFLKKLKPLSGFGWSKNLLDMHIAAAAERGDVKVPQWVGLKQFNSYGPNEYHKKEQQSIMSQILPQVKVGAAVKLFRSTHPDYADGEQKRDLIYVKDIAKVVSWVLANPSINGLYNLGSGTASSFNDMAKAVFSAVGKEPNISYIDMPDALKHNYQYYTKAAMSKLEAAGYNEGFTSLEDGVRDYVQNYLLKSDPYL